MLFYSESTRGIMLIISGFIRVSAASQCFTSIEIFVIKFFTYIVQIRGVNFWKCLWVPDLYLLVSTYLGILSFIEVVRSLDGQSYWLFSGQLFRKKKFGNVHCNESISLWSSEWKCCDLTRALEGGGADFALPSCFSEISKKNLRLDSYELFSTWPKMNGASSEKKKLKIDW